MSGASAEVVWDVGSLYDADPDTLDELYGPLPTNDMIVINVEYDFEDMDPAGPGELSADTVTKIDELYAADPVLGDRDSEKCKAAARKVGCTPSRLAYVLKPKCAHLRSVKWAHSGAELAGTLANRPR